MRELTSQEISFVYGGGNDSISLDTITIDSNRNRGTNRDNWGSSKSGMTNIDPVTGLKVLDPKMGDRVTKERSLFSRAMDYAPDRVKIGADLKNGPSLEAEWNNDK